MTGFSFCCCLSCRFSCCAFCCCCCLLAFFPFFPFGSFWAPADCKKTDFRALFRCLFYLLPRFPFSAASLPRLDRRTYLSSFLVYATANPTINVVPTHAQNNEHLLTSFHWDRSLSSRLLPLLQTSVAPSMQVF